ncbi:MAG: bifunctional enoyl-CoA hydratase/phosphate acetyltransferase [Betaproteobacteria bacterium]|nr:bifunctional enoyl-CoA hydratase/phosphate acetyltransferase [Betaproteobacteria bacterium]
MNAPNAPVVSAFIENRTYDEIKVGDTSVLTRTLRPEDIQLFAIMSGDVNPAHVDPEYARSSLFHEVIAHGMWGGALISTVLGTEFPGPGTIYISQTLKFSRPVKVGDTLTVTLTCKQKFDHNKHIIFDCACSNQDDMKVIRGEAEVLAPSEKIKRARMEMPEITISDREARYRRLFGKAQGLTAVRAAFVHPCDINSLQAALSVRDTGFMDPVLIGPQARLLALIKQHNLKLGTTRIVDVPHSHAAAARAVELARDREIEAMVQGSLTTEELLRECISAHGIRTSRRMSHVLYIDVPSYPRPLFITDTMVNIEPSLLHKVDIAQNAIDFAHILGVPEPKLAMLAGIETVTPRMRATLDAAALCKMADRGQITGAILDGPLGFDNAVSLTAARSAGLKSAVAGHADILLAPDLESANMLAKQLEHLSDAISGGVVLGGLVPIVLANRGDSIESRIASCVLALVLAHRRRPH